MNAVQLTAIDLWVSAQTAWGEARNQGQAGMSAVLWVIRNRHDWHARWRGKPLQEICQAPWQFSCWNAGDPNYPRLLALSIGDQHFRSCLQLAIDIFGGQLTATPVGKSTHYHTGTLALPAWAQGRRPYILLGDHIFYEGIA